MTITGKTKSGLMMGLVLSLTVLTGQTCDFLKPSVTENKPKTVPLEEQQRQRYPDLQSGKYLCLADFETEQVPGGILVIGGPSTQGVVPTPTPLLPGSQPASAPASEPASQPQEPLTATAWISRVGATGQHSLAWRVVANRDALRIGELKCRDWSPYALLLLNVYSTRDSGAVSVEIPSNKSVGRQRYRSAPVTLERGWNQIRLELSEVANVANLDDIGALWLIWNETAPVRTATLRNYDLHPDQSARKDEATRRAVPTTTQPEDESASRELLVDDILLVDNTKWVLGSENSPAGTPVTCYRGTHLWVGVKDVQEFGLQAGRITHLFDLKNDPKQAINLAGEAGLGPIPLPIPGRDPPVQVPERLPAGVLPAPLDPAEPWLALGRDVASDAKILESSRLRTVIETGLKFRDPRTGATEPLLWRYWFYPDGRVLVAVRLPGVKGPFNAGGNALVWTISDAVGGPEYAHPGADSNVPAWCWRLVGTGSAGDKKTLPDRPGLLVASSLFQPTKLLARSPLPGLHSVWAALPSASAVAYSQAFILTRPPYGAGYAERLVRDGSIPLRREVLAGRVAGEARWDVDHDGFAEMEGVYNFDPADGQLRVRLSSPDDPREPVYIRVRNVPKDASLHVALDGQLLFSGTLNENAGNVAWDGDGHLLIRLPRPVGTATELEVRILQ